MQHLICTVWLSEGTFHFPLIIHLHICILRSNVISDKTIKMDDSNFTMLVLKAVTYVQMSALVLRFLFGKHRV